MDIVNTNNLATEQKRLLVDFVSKFNNKDFLAAFKQNPRQCLLDNGFAEFVGTRTVQLTDIQEKMALSDDKNLYLYFPFKEAANDLKDVEFDQVVGGFGIVNGAENDAALPIRLSDEDGATRRSIRWATYCCYRSEHRCYSSKSN
jgi:hypothetical protein